MWNAELYDRYGKERVQPSVDLVARLKDRSFKRILDVGCGTGISTAALCAAWNDAEVIGADLSEEMLRRATAALPAAKFVKRDCAEPLGDLGTFDLVFSNAFIQWLADQDAFIADAFEILGRGGVFAAQIPLFHEMPASKCIDEAVGAFRSKFIKSQDAAYRTLSPYRYYDIVAKHTPRITTWVTDYWHEMDCHESVLDFLKGTALHPHLACLGDEDKKLFLNDVLDRLTNAYPRSQNGKVLFPFKRLFLIAEKV